MIKESFLSARKFLANISPASAAIIIAVNTVVLGAVLVFRETMVWVWVLALSDAVLIYAMLLAVFRRQREEKEHIEREVIERTQELKDERARLTASIDSIPFGFLIADNNGRVLMENAALAKLFRLDGRKGITIEGIGKQLGNNIDLKGETEQCMKGRAVCRIPEMLFESKFLRALIAPVLTADNKERAIGYILLFEDITEAKVLERSRNEFFAVASHELRTPLTAIRGNSAMLLDQYKNKILDADGTAMLADVHDASVRLIDIVSDFLDVAGLEQGNIAAVIARVPVDLSEQIELAIREATPSAEKKGVSIVVKNNERISSVTGDKGRLRQVFANLIGNAVKFSPTKGVVTVEIVPDEKKGFVRILVSDTGVGIPQERQGLLFHKFQQAGEQVLARDLTQGTGLGLYISKLLVERMGGAMGLLKSTPGEGSTFYFTLPVAK